MLLETINFLLGVVAIVLSVVATIFAYVQHKDAKETLRLTREALVRLEGTAEVLGETATQLPTRYIGKFPLNIREIIDLIKRAETNITVLSDFAGYGSFSNFDLFWEYEQALWTTLRNKPNLKIEMFVYDGDLRRKVALDQLSGVDPTGTSGGQEERERIARFKERVKQKGIEVHDSQSFINAILADEVRTLRKLNGEPRLDCYEVHCEVPIFIWMVAGRDCVFSFESTPTSRSYFSFRTRDGRLIDYFTQYLHISTDGGSRIDY